jgi:outer membrane protein TolC
VLAGMLSSKGIGTNGILTGPGLSAELPIFHRNQGLIARADADVEVASRQYLNLKQRVRSRSMKHVRCWPRLRTSWPS